MAGKGTLSRAAIRQIGFAVDGVFDKVAARYLGPDTLRSWGDKQISVGYRPGLTLPELYASSARDERSKPAEDVMESLARIAKGYLDATKEKTKARVVANVDRFLRDADVDTDLDTVLTGHLNDVFGEAKREVIRILDTENTHARNLGAMEGITKVNASMGIEDPVVYFIVVKDKDLCEECEYLHTLMDKPLTPKVWKLSEVRAGYHHRGDENPKLGGLHPHCRCSMATLMPGYGFKGGAVSFISLGHDEFKKQRG